MGHLNCILSAFLRFQIPWLKTYKMMKIFDSPLRYTPSQISLRGGGNGLPPPWNRSCTSIHDLCLQLYYNSHLFSLPLLIAIYLDTPPIYLSHENNLLRPFPSLYFKVLNKNYPESLYLGRKDVNLGRKDANLGRKDVNLGRKDVNLGRKDANLGRKDANLGRKDANLGRKDANLGRKCAIHI